MEWESTEVAVIQVVESDKVLPDTVWWHEYRNQFFTFLKDQVKAERSARAGQPVGHNVTADASDSLEIRRSAAPLAMLKYLVLQDTNPIVEGLSEEERFLLALFHPFSDLLRYHSDLVNEIRRVIECLNERFLHDSIIRISPKKWARIWDRWRIEADGSYMDDAGLLSQLEKADRSVKDCEYIKGGKEDEWDMRPFVDWACDESNGSQLLSLRRLACFLRGGYVSPKYLG